MLLPSSNGNPPAALNAEQGYYLLIGLVVGSAFTAAFWYYRFSQHRYRRKKGGRSRPLASIFATIETVLFLGAMAAGAWLLMRP